MSDLTNKIASTHLGKKSSGSSFYDPSLLVVVPRIENRKQYNISNSSLPFEGYDVWHAYEFSCLTEKGLPLTKVLKIKYNCNNDFLIESKSLKLYLNSFNMSRFGKNREECLKICQSKIINDLSERLKTEVLLEFLNEELPIVNLFSNYVNIMDNLDEETLNVEIFKEFPEVLIANNLQEKKEYRLHFDSLRSNCRVTHQPDFGDAFIYYKSQKHIDEISLVKYLTSFRSEFHFHEECCEMIYKRLQDLLDDGDELFVCALYTRRGGIDICPSRWSKNIRPKELDNLLNVSKYAIKGIKQ